VSLVSIEQAPYPAKRLEQSCAGPRFSPIDTTGATRAHLPMPPPCVKQGDGGGPLLGVEETAHGRASHPWRLPRLGPRGSGLPVCASGSCTRPWGAFSPHLAFDRPLPPDSPPQPPSGMAVPCQLQPGYIPQEVIGTIPILDQSPMHIGQRSYCSDHTNDARVILASISFRYSKEVFGSCNQVQQQCILFGTNLKKAP